MLSKLVLLSALSHLTAAGVYQLYDCTLSDLSWSPSILPLRVSDLESLLDSGRFSLHGYWSGRSIYRYRTCATGFGFVSV